jgi:hypothetical protein
LTGLVKQVDKVVAGSKQGIAVVVLLDDKKDAAVAKLKALREKNGLSKVALTVNGGGTKSPGGYKLNPAVKHTVLVYTKKKVLHNFATNTLSAAEAGQITAAAKKVLGS